MIREIMPLDQVLRKRAVMTPRATFVKFEGKKFSNREMDRLATVFASELIKRGMKPGDPVALLCHNCPHYIAAYFGIIRGGGIVLPLNNLLAADEIDFILRDASVRVCLYDADCAGTVERLARSGTLSFFTLSDLAHAPFQPESFAPLRHTADDISTILYTSGTTGRPKGALLTHRNFLMNALAATEVIHVTHKDRFVVFLPLFHSFTYTVCVILPLITGAMISLLPGVRPFSKVVRSLILDRITLVRRDPHRV
jgi:long-chain acyl-CoA synthetase